MDPAQGALDNEFVEGGLQNWALTKCVLINFGPYHKSKIGKSPSGPLNILSEETYGEYLCL